MIIDTNAYLGHFAFRQLHHNTADSLLRIMDHNGIDRAMVSSAAAITYRNTQSANEELAKEATNHRDRLTPFAVINPSYAGWQDDLLTCHERFGVRGLRLYPKWHNYALTDDCLLKLIQKATELNLLISIPIRVEDYRQRSWLVDVQDVPQSELVELVKACPDARFLFLNGRGYTGSLLGKANNGLPRNYWIESSRLHTTMDNELGILLDRLGLDRVVYGSGSPFKCADPSLIALDVLDAEDSVKEKIRNANAARLLEIPSK